MLLPDRRMRRIARRLHVEKWRDPIGAERIDAASAAVVATRRSLLTEVPLPEQYFMYWEESEWFWRLHRRGAVVQVRPEVVCRHDGGRGAGSLRVDAGARAGGRISAHRAVVRAAVDAIDVHRPSCVVIQNYVLPPLEHAVHRAARRVGARVVVVVHDDRLHTWRAGT